jgi:hypothetical protein
MVIAPASWIFFNVPGCCAAAGAEKPTAAASASVNMAKYFIGSSSQ